ncbi:MAG: DUF2027 domain-containing protein [Bacteroidales bacterium]|nr:DUF2027 domain-containing protein [Bacteroidales bacterium]
MKLAVGDKVKFLNQTGGGVVSKIVSSQIVNVTDETGFDIPTLIKDLVKVEPATGAGKLFEQEIIVPTPDSYAPQSGPQVSDTDIVPLRRVPEQRNIEQGVYLAFVPHQQSWLITGDLDVLLVNRTPHTLLASVFTKHDDSFHFADYEAIDPESRYLVATIDREEVSQWLHGVVQALFIRNKTQKLLKPLSEEFRIKASKFYKEESYANIACLGQNALLVEIAKLLDLPAFAEIAQSATAEPEPQPKQQETKKKKSHIVNPNNILEQHIIAQGVAEVNLHIEELTDDDSSLSDQEKLGLQLSYFQRCVNDAIANHVQKVIFIHGVGQGVLKNEIIKELRQYQGVHFFDAPMAKYGVGATEVYFGNNVSKES